MSKKTVQLVAKPPSSHWVGDGFKVHNFIPRVRHLSMEEMDPFILLDYNATMKVPPSDTPRGVSVHPHRGFETVTIAYQGRVEHHDSEGGGGIIGQGDVQWMTASTGILHKEYHETEWSKKGGNFQMVQLWVNLSAKAKKHAPRYQAITNEQMGRYQLPNAGGVIEVIAGEYEGVKGPAITFSPIYLFNAKLKSDAEAVFKCPAQHNTALLVIKGSILVNGSTEAPADNMVKFNSDGDEFTIKASEDSIVLLLSGEPLKEPIVSYGPFVMNTEQEIREAISDYNSGKFGHLDE